MSGDSSAVAPVPDAPVGSQARWYNLVLQLLDIGVREISEARARRSMTRVRRDPADLEQALRRATSMLIVCHGNIIRSPFAACVLRKMLGPSTSLTIGSAGVEAVPGRPAHPYALDVAAELEVDMSHHLASRLSAEDVRTTDVIFAVDVMQLVAIRQRFPEARSKTYLLTCLAPRTPLEIRDPIGGDEPVFVACYGHILDAIRPIAQLLSERTPHSHANSQTSARSKPLRGSP